MRVVSNAGPLIALARIECFHLLRPVFGRILIPQAVYHEVVELGAGRAGAEAVRRAVGDWIEVQSVRQVERVQDLLANLGPGEAEALALALELPADLVLLDDRKARSAAEFLKMPITGTIGFLDLAYRQGQLPGLREPLARLKAQGFWIDQQLERELLGPDHNPDHLP